MKTILSLCKSLLVALFFISCTNTYQPKYKVVDDSPYLNKYAGRYTIQVKGMPSTNEREDYALAPNGHATWVRIINDRSEGNKTQQQKTGTWTATQNKITISIQGNTGTIVEKYNLTDGQFVNTTFRDRYLKKIQ